MKEMILLLILTLSCQTQDGFTGFGELKINADFAILKRAKDFKSAPDNHFINDFEIGDIGSVADLEVKTERSKIVSVAFTTNDKTDIGKMEKIFAGLVEVKQESVLPYTPVPNGVRSFVSADRKIYMIVQTVTFGKRKKYKVSYDDNERYLKIVKEANERRNSR
jgi:hypothetical protein